MKKKYIGVVVILLVVMAFFGYKGINLFMYDINSVTTADYYEVIVKGLEIKNTKTIKTNVNENTEYLTMGNIKVQNYFKDFQKIAEANKNNDVFSKYVLYGNDFEVSASFWLGVAEDTYVNMFKAKATDYALGDNKFIKINRADILKTNNITTDIEFIEYLVANKDNKNNIFTSVKEMKENYAIQVFTSVALPVVESISLIDGDYTGYMFNLNNIKECNIIHNGKRYVFTFLQLDYFSEEKIMEILNTIVIN